MSAKDRALAQQKREDARFWQDVDNGLRLALASPEGQTLIWWLYQVEGLGEQPAYTVNAPEHTSYREGRRSVALALAERARRADPQGWLAMRELHELPKARAADPREPEQQEEDDA